MKYKKYNNNNYNILIIITILSFKYGSKIFNHLIDNINNYNININNIFIFEST